MSRTVKKYLITLSCKGHTKNVVVMSIDPIEADFLWKLKQAFKENKDSRPLIVPELLFQSLEEWNEEDERIRNSTVS